LNECMNQRLLHAIDETDFRNDGMKNKKACI
jgi:hypothetical protein